MDDKLEKLKRHICDLGYESVIVFDSPGYVDAFLGVSDEGRAVYSYDRMIECLMTEDGMDYDEAIEFIDFNTIRALPYMGDKAPIVVYDDPDWEEMTEEKNDDTEGKTAKDTE